MRRRYEAGESVKAIARAHKGSPHVVELRLQRLGLMPTDDWLCLYVPWTD